YALARSVDACRGHPAPDEDILETLSLLPGAVPSVPMLRLAHSSRLCNPVSWPPAFGTAQSRRPDRLWIVALRRDYTEYVLAQVEIRARFDRYRWLPPKTP